ncbi:diacylglycerol/polyprenol kinase family protein [Luteolibacter pohnpeiensis]|nr:hypothetical protein [Luteolibacter pohnpeiensis]
MPLIRFLTVQLGASPEVARKSVHVMMGLLCAAFPWIFDGPVPVWVLAAMATVPLTVLRLVPKWKAGIGAALHGVGRPSYGEVLFAPSVALVFQLAAGRALLHVIPIGILTIADAAGALAGTKWGKRRYGCGDGWKTIEGSLVFLVAAFFCVSMPLIILGGYYWLNATWIALILAILAMMAEGLADRGFDNLIIPLGAFFVLNRMLPLDHAALLARSIALIAMLTLVLGTSKWSTLNGGALLGAALLGYGCAILADFRFALPLIAVFVCHIITTRKNRLLGVFDHRLDAILAHAISCLPWVILVERGIISHQSGLAGVSFAIASLLGIMDMATKWWLHDRPSTLAHSMTKGWVLGALPGLVWLWPEMSELLVPFLIALIGSACVILIFRKVRPQVYHHPTRLWLIKGITALLSSIPALLIKS